MLPLKLMLVIVTFAPLCVSLPFQIWVTVSPFAKAKVSVQLEMAVFPELLMVCAYYLSVMSEK